MRGAIALLAVLYGARGEYPCAKEGVTNCSAVTYDDPFARGDKPKTTFTDEAYTARGEVRGEKHRAGCRPLRIFSSEVYTRYLTTTPAACCAMGHIGQTT